MKARGVAFAVALLALPAMAQPAFQAPAKAAGDLRLAVKSAVLDCVTSRPLPSSEYEDAPALPGLGRPTASVVVRRIKTSIGDLYEYTAKSRADIFCGVVLYKASDKALVADAAEAIQHATRFREFQSPLYILEDEVSPPTRYFGDPLGGGLEGVEIFSRAPSESAPSFQVDYHKLLIR